jgi:Tol biopolymer transport system component
MIGRSLGPYRFLEQLGAGGMGEVYLAEDTRLARKVAIKVLPPKFAQDAERLARFEQEARAAAALNHPHIATVYDVGSEIVGDGSGASDAGSTGGAAQAPEVTHFIVQEYLEGEPLRAVLDRDPLPLDRALELGAEIGEGLAAAHRAGIVHRDLKPENVFVAPDGHVKILDFGLAKLFEAEATPEDGDAGATGDPSEGVRTASPTMLGPAWGEVVGTVGYMAPEQVEGRKVDRRADIFAFGCMLYEMVTGVRPFEGASFHETLHRIGHAEAEPLQRLDPDLPAQLQWIVAKCLAKRPDRRYQNAGDLVVDLRNLARDVEAGVAEAGPAPPAAGEPEAFVPAEPQAGSPLAAAVPLPAAIAAGVVLATVAVIVTLLTTGGGSSETPARVPREFAIDLDGFLSIGSRDSLALSPDGTRLVFSARDSEGLHGLFLHDLAANTTTFIAGTEGGDRPFFSPDGLWVAYRDSDDRLLKKILLEGGDPFVLSRVSFVAEGAWGPDDTIVYTNGDLLRISAAGGEEPVTLLSEEDAAVEMGDPEFLPGGRAVLVVTRPSGNERNDGPPGIAVFELETRELTPLINDGFHPRFVPGGHIVYARGNALYAVSFDVSSLRVTGDPRLVRQGVRSYARVSSEFTTADDGTLVYVPGEASESGHVIARATLEGELTPLAVDRLIVAFAVSPDGRRIAAAVVAEESEAPTRIRIFDLPRPGGTQILAERGYSPVWSSNGEWVYFTEPERADPADGSEAANGRSAANRLLRKRLGSGEEPELVEVVPQFIQPFAFGTDPGRLLVGFGHPRRPSIGWLDLADGGAPETLPGVVGGSRASLSPDGRLLAFDRRDAGTSQIWVYDLEGKQSQLVGPGFEPRWAHDGGRLFYLDGTWMMSATVSTEPQLDVGTPEPRFFHPAQPVLPNFHVDPLGDGFLMLVRNDQAQGMARPQIRVVVDWSEQLRAPQNGQR